MTHTLTYNLKWIILLALLTGVAWADMPADVRQLQDDWASIQYALEADQRAAALEKLAARAKTLSENQPTSAEALVWRAIIVSTLAGERGGLGALDLVKTARDLLLEAEKIDSEVLQGSVYTSLGSLYYQVPGWPLGFGDHKQARVYLEKALELNPEGIDPNYFYGDFLLEEGDYQEAEVYLERALNAPPRPGRELADQGRAGEIRSALEKAQEKQRGGFGW